MVRGAAQTSSPSKIDFCDRSHTGMAKSWAMKAALTSRVSTADKALVPQHPEGNMTVSQSAVGVTPGILITASKILLPAGTCSSDGSNL